MFQENLCDFRKGKSTIKCIFVSGRVCYYNGCELLLGDVVILCYSHLLQPLWWNWIPEGFGMLLKNWLVKHFVYVACIFNLCQMHKCLLWQLVSISKVKCRCNLFSIKIKLKKIVKPNGCWVEWWFSVTLYCHSTTFWRQILYFFYYSLYFSYLLHRRLHAVSDPKERIFKLLYVIVIGKTKRF